MSKLHTLKLKGDRQVECVYKIAMGQNSSDGIPESDTYYELGMKRWNEMANNRLLILDDKNLDFAIGACDSLAFSMLDNADDTFDGREYRAKGRAFRRLQKALMKIWLEAHR